MRRALFLLGVTCLLAACQASLSSGVVGDVFQQESSLPPAQTYQAKFSTHSAMNSFREFPAEYHGSIMFAVDDNQKINCHWNASGRITDQTVYSGINGFVDAYSTVCIGKIALDGTYSFRGSMVGNVPENFSGSGELLDTFTLRGQLKHGEVYGELVLPGVFAAQVSDELGQRSSAGLLFAAPVAEQAEQIIEDEEGLVEIGE